MLNWAESYVYAMELLEFELECVLANLGAVHAAMMEDGGMNWERMANAVSSTISQLHNIDARIAKRTEQAWEERNEVQQAPRGRCHDVQAILNIGVEKERLRGGKNMSYYHTCPECGANLDPGEICDCKIKKLPASTPAKHDAESYPQNGKRLRVSRLYHTHSLKSR